MRLFGGDLERKPSHLDEAQIVGDGREADFHLKLKPTGACTDVCRVSVVLRSSPSWAISDDSIATFFRAFSLGLDPDRKQSGLPFMTAQVLVATRPPVAPLTDWLDVDSTEEVVVGLDDAR